MDSDDFARWIPKGRRTPLRRRTPSGIRKSVVLLPDLNSPPADGVRVGVPSSSIVVSQNQSSNTIQPTADQPQIGNQSYRTDVVVSDNDDDDVMIYLSRPFPQTRQRSTRTEPIIVIIDDDDSEANMEPEGETLEHVNTLLSLGINRPVISLLDTPEVSVKPTVVETPPEPVTVKDTPKEPKFTCPVCLNELTEASSTKCGHIFCQKCIKAAIKAQKKCPTCREKLSPKNVHRVYLPKME